jgi:hypothetical protein
MEFLGLIRNPIENTPVVEITFNCNNARQNTDIRYLCLITDSRAF